MPPSLVASTPLPVRLAIKRGLAGVVQRGILKDRNAAEVHAAGRAGGLISLAGHQRQAAGTLRPDARVVGGIDAAAGESGAKRGLAGIVQRGRNEAEAAEVHAAGRARGLAPTAGDSARLPEPSDQMPAVVCDPTPLPVSLVINAVWPASFSTGLNFAKSRNRECSEVHAAGRAGGLIPAAGDQRQAAGTLRPDAFVISRESTPLAR